ASTRFSAVAFPAHPDPGIAPFADPACDAAKQIHIAGNSASKTARAPAPRSAAARDTNPADTPADRSAPAHPASWLRFQAAKRWLPPPPLHPPGDRADHR